MFSIQQAIDAQLENGEIPSNLTYFWNVFIQKKTSLLDYVSKDAYLIIDDYARFIEKEQNVRRRGGILEDAPYRNRCDCFWIVACSRWTKSIKGESPLKRTYLPFSKRVLKTRARCDSSDYDTYDDAVLLANADGESRSGPLEETRRNSYRLSR